MPGPDPRQKRTTNAPPSPQSPDVLAALAEAAKGLTYPSEADAPFDVISPGDTAALTAEQFVTRQAKTRGKIEEVQVEQFFKELDATDDAERYRNLQRVLESTLSDVRVLRAGSVKVNVYLVGRTRSGSWTGLHTTSVET